MLSTTDVVVIGGGPAGSMAALEVVRRGLDVILLEDHPIIGDPNHCSGLISKRGIDRLNVPYPNTIIDNSVNAVNFYSPSNHCLTVRRKEKGELLVFQRNNLDRTLAEYAELKGVEIRLNSKVKSLYRRSGAVAGVEVSPKQGTSYRISSRVVIDAEGSNAKFLSEAGLRPPDQKWRLPAMQFELDNVPNFPRDVCELYHGKEWAPGFFCWIIPACKDSVRIGVATFPRFGTARLLKKFLNFHPVASKSLQDAIITKKRGGVVAACGPVKQAHAPGFLAAGDAAGQVKATTGGGVNIGGFCGRLAGYVATQNILNGVPLKKYDNLWKREYYLELRLMEIYRKIVGQLSDYALDQAIKAASGSAFEKKLSKTVDIDRHSLDLIRATLSPRPVLAGVKMLPELLWASGKFLLSEFQFS